MQIETVKNYCDITWSDEQTDDKVADILDRAQSELESYAGETLDFSDEKTTLAQLLLDCCWYILNRALNEFRANYKDDLNSLRQQYQVKRYIEKNGGDSDAEAEDPEF